jgi:Mrp family chromosome partitioning ATPase
MPENGETNNPEGAQRDSFERPEQTSGQHLVRLLKPITFRSEVGKAIDEMVVAPHFYNCFNYSLLSKEQDIFNLTIGVTSANSGEGKTLVASNLAVSLAITNQREVVLVDLNIRNPRLHSIFGTKLSPGLVESLGDSAIQVVPTRVKHLYLLPAGNPIGSPHVVDRLVSQKKSRPGTPQKASLGLEQLAAFRDVVYSLKQTFEFVVIDMPAIQEPRIPIQLTHQMDGLLVVVDANRTKQMDIERTFTQLSKSQILGFVMNRASD